MDGDGEGISIAAIFISRESGETLAELAGYTGVDIRITGNDDSVDHSTRVDAVNTFFGVLFALFAIGLLIFESPDVMMYLRCLLFPVELPSPELLTYVRPPNRMRRNLVKAMPCVVYNPVVDPNRTDTSCVICLEEFTRGEKLRLLPCNHSKFTSLRLSFSLSFSVPILYNFFFLSYIMNIQFRRRNIIDYLVSFCQLLGLHKVLYYRANILNCSLIVPLFHFQWMIFEF